MCKTIELRDQIAIEAMKLALADPAVFYNADYVAKNCYALADAMMAARESNWVTWDGGPCPFDEKALLDVRDRDGTEHKRVRISSIEADPIFWEYHEKLARRNDIVAYRVVKA